MDLPISEEDEMPVPLNSRYVGGGQGHIIHHDHHNNNINTQLIPSSNGASTVDNHSVPPFKKNIVVRYKECLKNHAASMGGNATDGCGEFMPSGEDGSLEALTCSACNCHRNFHRKEVEGGDHLPRIMGFNKLYMGHHHQHHRHMGVGPPHPQMIMSYNMGGASTGGGGGGSDSDDANGGGGGGGMGVRGPPHHHGVKKRFRTKFTQDQKERMLSFAERVGWKLQKQDETVVQQFCQEIGIKRRVLKVWMHNNKHTLAKKLNINQHSNDASSKPSLETN